MGFDAFLIEMGEGFLELDTLREDGGAAWAGTAGCTIIVEVLKAFFSGGGSLGAKFGVRFKSLLDKLPMDARTRDRLDAMLGEDRDGDGRTDDRDDDSACSVYGGSCGCNSFPAGTLVLLASGAYRPIEMIDPGERVVTYDTASGVWRDQPVLAQWSGIHDGAMATIHFDGGSLSSTDGHEFWVNDRGEWVEAGQLQPGDLLLGPDGVARVESVALTDGAGSVVWELDTATDNNFITGLGVVAVLAHNTSCHVDGDGTVTTIKDDGSLMRDYADGAVEYVNAEGIRTDLDGNILQGRNNPYFDTYNLRQEALESGSLVRNADGSYTSAGGLHYSTVDPDANMLDRVDHVLQHADGFDKPDKGAHSTWGPGVDPIEAIDEAWTNALPDPDYPGRFDGILSDGTPIRIIAKKIDGSYSVVTAFPIG